MVSLEIAEAIEGLESERLDDLVRRLRQAENDECQLYYAFEKSDDHEFELQLCRDRCFKLEQEIQVEVYLIKKKARNYENQQ